MSTFLHEKTGSEKTTPRRSVAQQISLPGKTTHALQKMQRLVNDSPAMVAQRQLLDRVLQRDEIAAPLEEEELSAAAGTSQTKQKDNTSTASHAPVAQKKGNDTGLPDTLKAGTEALSGIALDDVRVHYGSSKPAQLNAHAYAQGTDIHVAPGQEQHLPHEAWHVVQQKQGRVAPTITVDDVAVNDDPTLEREADVMGAKAQHAPV